MAEELVGVTGAMMTRLTALESGKPPSVIEGTVGY
jgi:hypothetical protein